MYGTGEVVQSLKQQKRGVYRKEMERNDYFVQAGN